MPENIQKVQMNNEQLILSALRAGFGYTDAGLHVVVNETRKLTREDFSESIKKLQIARLVHRKNGNLFKTLR